MKKATASKKGGYFSYALLEFFYFVGMALFSSVMSVYLTDIGKSASEMSFIISSGSIFSFIMIPLSGYLSDVLHNQKLIGAIFLGSAGVFALLFAGTRNVFLLFILNGLIASGINSVMPLCERMIAATPYRYGSLRMWGSMGFAVGAQAAGFLIEVFPPWSLFVALFAVLVIAIICFLGTQNIDFEPSEEEKETGEKPKASSLLRIPQFLLYVIVGSVFAACSSVNMSYVPVLLDRMGVSTTTVGTVLFFSTLVEIPMVLYSNKYMDKFSGKALLAASFVLLGVQFVFYGVLRSEVVIIAVVVLLKAIASMLFVMINLKMVRNLISGEWTTTGLAVINCVNSFFTLVLQNLSGMIVDRTDVHTLYLGLTALLIIGLIMTAFIKVKDTHKVFS